MVELVFCPECNAWHMEGDHWMKEGTDTLPPPKVEPSIKKTSFVIPRIMRVSKADSHLGASRE